MPDFTYSGDPSGSDLDAVRFYIGDTDITDPLMGDGEIAFALTLGSTLAAAVICCEAIASKFARRCDKEIGAAKLAASQKAEAYERRAAKLRALIVSSGSGISPFAGGISIVQKRAQESDTDRVVPSFAKEMFAYDDTPLEADT